MTQLYKDCIIIDVRDPYEFRQGHIDQAINIPFENLSGTLPFGPFAKLAVYSSSGYHSKMARKVLEKRGFEVDDLGDYDGLHLQKSETNRIQPDCSRSPHACPRRF